MDSSEYEYLLPDFNPSKYKVAQLRGVLVKNDVSFPSNAKKQDLIDLFNEQIKPTAAQKLKELQSVVASNDRIEVVEKKTRSPKKAAAKKKAVTPEPEEQVIVPRRSPRKVSRSKTDESDAVDLGKAPILRNLSPPPPAKKEEEESESPKKKKTRTSKVKKEEEKLEPPKRKRGRPSKAVKKQVVSSASESDSDVSMVTQEEFEASAAFKAKAKNRDVSFSNDNVFQSPSPSSPDFKTKKLIPKKRSAEASTSKTPKKPLRKTAFSSSPEPEPSLVVKSPPKKSLGISKFEASSPILVDKTNGLFDLDDNPKQQQEVPPSDPPQPQQDTPQQVNRHDDTIFATPNDGNASRISATSPSLDSPAKTPGSVKRRSLIPDFSKFKVSTEFAKTLGSKLPSFGTPEKKPEEKPEEKDYELLEDEEEQEEEVQDDSTLIHLRDEIENANATVLKETEEAIKQVNEIFSSEKEEVVQEIKKIKAKTPSIKWFAVLGFFKQLLIFVMFLVPIIFGLWYREQRILIGYCGSEIYQPTFPNTDNEYLLQLESILDSVKPECLPCPENAICLPSMKIKCKQDHIAYQPWYKLYGILPFSDYCVPDKEKEDIISEVVAKSLDLLRTRNADIKCGDGDDLEVGISNEELYQFFYNSKKASISDEEFNDIWAKVLQDLENEPEITLRLVELDGEQPAQDDLPSDEDQEETDLPQVHHKTVFRSTSNAKLSMSCKFKKEVYERVQANKGYIVAFGTLLVAGVAAYYKYLKFMERRSKVREVSDIIITKLKKQQKNAMTDSTGLTNRYLSAIQLRDELLSTMSGNEKFKLWDNILVELEKNSNIRSSTKEIHGEIVRVLKWVGEL